MKTAKIHKMGKETAEVEGLYEALEETTDLRLKDLVERRLLYAYYFVTDGSKVE